LIELIASLSMLSLAVLSYREAHSWLFPPALFSLYWAIVIGVSAVVRYGGDPLSLDALFVFMAGCLVFSAGGWVAVLSLGTGGRVWRVDARRKRFVQMCIVAYSAGLLALTPFFAIAIYRAGASLDIEILAVAARTAFLESGRAGIPRFYLSLTSVGSVLAYIAAWMYDGSRRDKGILLLAVLAPLAMSVLTFSRSPVYALIVGVFSIMVFRRTMRPRTALGGISIGTMLAVAMGVMLGKGPEFGPGVSPVYAVAENLAVYFLGGPVGFSQVMGIPISVGEPGLSLRFFTQLAQSLGADIALPDHILGYYREGMGNVYTIYFAYWLDGGWWGVVVMSFLAGALCTSVYVWAMMGNPVAGAAFGLVTGSILTSAIGDGIFGSSVPWLLFLAVVGILWSVPAVSIRFTRQPMSLSEDVLMDNGESEGRSQ
jgi:oligosaccharide repeat unit polymerase